MTYVAFRTFMQKDPFLERGVAHGDDPLSLDVVALDFLGRSGAPLQLIKAIGRTSDATTLVVNEVVSRGWWELAEAA